MDGFEISGLPFVVTGAPTRRWNGRARGQGTDRLLRLDPGLPAGARPARMGRAAGRADPDVQGGSLDRDARAHQRRHPRRVRDRRPSRPVAEAISKRYGDLFTRLHLYLKAPLRKDVELSIAEELRRQPSR